MQLLQFMNQMASGDEEGINIIEKIINFQYALNASYAINRVQRRISMLKKGY